MEQGIIIAKLIIVQEVVIAQAIIRMEICLLLRTRRIRLEET